jgi:hypothetical protein
VLIHGSAESTEHLRQHCLKHVCQYVYAPRIGEAVDVTSDLSAYKVSLTMFLCFQYVDTLHIFSTNVSMAFCGCLASSLLQLLFKL